MNLFLLNRYLFAIVIGMAFCLSSNSQTIYFNNNKSTLYKNDFFSISITFSPDAKKEYLAYKNYQFPDIADMVKSHTYFYNKGANEKGYKITQWYEPIKVGSKTIPTISLQTKNETFTNPSFKITVLSETTEEPSEPPSESWIGKTKLQYESPELEWHLTSEQVSTYPMQPIHIVGYLLIPINNNIPFTFVDSHEQKERLKKAIKNSNCLIQDRDYSNTFNQDTIIRDDKRYLKLTIINQFFFPQKAGEIKIPDTEWSVYCYKKGINDEGIIRIPEKLSLKSKGKTINVLELPPHPSNKIIPVGNFYMRDFLETKRIRNGQATYFSVVIETNTDPSSIGSLDFLSSEIELMDEELVSQRVLDGDSWRVRKEIKFQINPLRSGQYQLSEAFRYIYFNPTKRAYDTIRPRSTLHVYGERISESNAMLTNDEFYNRYNHQTKSTVFDANKNDLFNHLANLIILVMLAVTAILVIKK